MTPHERNVSVGRQVELVVVAHAPTPSPTVPVSTQCVASGIDVSSVQAAGAVAAPGRPQIPAAHSPLLVQGIPTNGSEPGKHRLPPQTVAPTATHSALVAHGVEAALSHVSQKQRPVVQLVARQSG